MELWHLFFCNATQQALVTADVDVETGWCIWNIQQIKKSKKPLYS